MPWPVHPNGLLGAQGDNDGYKVERSLRFNSADLAYLSRTFAGAGTSKTTATLSLWVKRAKISGSNYADAFYESHTTNYNIFGFSGSTLPDTLYFTFRNGGSFYSSNLFRDTSAWYHILINYDSTNATQADRFRFYVNGVRGTFNPSYTPAFALNYEFEGDLGVAGAKLIGSFYAISGYEPNFYLAEYHFVDGQALSASSFTETDATTGRLKAKAYSGTYGNHGFYLKFADNSNNTLTTLGKDSSPNGSNWTPNNFSVTAGTGNDSLVDSPTNYGTDIGVGGEVRGNYATANFLDQSGCTFTNGLLDVAMSGSGFAVSSIGVSSGKWYAEVIVTAASLEMIGICQIDGTIASRQYIGANGWYYYSTGQKYNNGTGASYGATYTTNDIIGIALDMDSGSVTFYKNGTTQGVAYNSGISGKTIGFALGRGSAAGSNTVTLNFGQRPFAYTAPTGFKALCTTNLTTPTIKKPSTAMDVVAYTGTGASNSISSLGFSPDLVWIKNRGGATSHAIYDTTRLATKQLSSDTTGDEATSSTGLTAFGSNGFTLGTSTLVNTSGTQYVAWAWDEAPVAGFDVVNYLGDGSAGKNISHNLGVAPKFMIVKNRVTAGFDFVVYHASMNATPQNGYMALNGTLGYTANSAIWNNTAPTSSVFTVGTDTAVNKTGENHIAYLWAEIDGFSKIGSYVGNSSADGVFVWCGFRPRYILFKNPSGGTYWQIYDAARNTYNVVNSDLYAGNAAAEQTDASLDMLANGFKARSITYINDATINFVAFAESPFKYARAR